MSGSMETCAKKLVKCRSGLKMVPVNDTFQSPLHLKEPSWVPDDEVVMHSCLHFSGPEAIRPYLFTFSP